MWDLPMYMGLVGSVAYVAYKLINLSKPVNPVFRQIVLFPENVFAYPGAFPDLVQKSADPSAPLSVSACHSACLFARRNSL